MTRVRRINVSQVEGRDANNTNDDEIRPFGEAAIYIDDNGPTDKPVLAIHDGVRTHIKSKVLGPGVLYGSNADAGDDSGADTIKLIPDATLFDQGSNQYIVVDPTAGEPGHIHLRAGGTQDASSADLYLGGELTCVRVSDTSGIVTIRTTSVGDPNITKDWAFESDGNLYFPGVGNNRIGESEPGLVISSDNAVVLQSNNGGEGKELTFGTDGSLVFPTGAGQINPQVSDGVGLQIEADLDFEIKVSDGEGGSTIWSFAGNDITFPDGSVQSTAYTGENGGGAATGLESEEAVEIRVNLTDSTTRVWRFGEDGNLTFPETFFDGENETATLPKIEFPIPNFGNTAGTIGVGPAGIEITVLDSTWGFSPEFEGGGFLTLPGGGKITELEVDGTPTIVLEPADALDPSQKLLIKGGQQEEPHLHLTTGDLQETSIFLGTDEHNVRTTHDQGVGGVEITARSYFNETSTVWRFFPELTGEGTVPAKIIFPDNTEQRTAWAGGRVVGSPSFSTGAEGDTAGDLAFTNDYIYYCIADYTDGQSNIWKRIAWSGDTW